MASTGVSELAVLRARLALDREPEPERRIHADGSEEDVPLTHVHTGNMLRVRPGENPGAYCGVPFWLFAEPQLPKTALLQDLALLHVRGAVPVGELGTRSIAAEAQAIRSHTADADTGAEDAGARGVGVGANGLSPRIR